MKAVILAAGRGSRINSFTKGKNKCTLEVKGKSIIEHSVYNISLLEEVDEIIIVVGYKSHDVMSKVGNHSNDKRVSYCIQNNQTGLIDALNSVEYAVGESDFMLVLGDEFVVNNRYSQAIRKFYEKKYSSMIGIVEVDNIDLVKKTYTINIDEDGNILDLVEKPKKPFNNIMGTGNIIFKGNLLKYIKDTPINPIRGEKELVDFLKIILERKGNVTTFKVGEHYVNLNTKEDYNYLSKLI